MAVLLPHSNSTHSIPHTALPLMSAPFAYPHHTHLPAFLLTPPDEPRDRPATKRKHSEPSPSRSSKAPKYSYTMQWPGQAAQRPSTSYEPTQQQGQPQLFYLPALSSYSQQQQQRPVSQPVAPPALPPWNPLAYRPSAAQYSSLNSPVSPPSYPNTHERLFVHQHDDISVSPIERIPSHHEQGLQPHIREHQANFTDLSNALQGISFSQPTTTALPSAPSSTSLAPPHPLPPPPAVDPSAPPTFWDLPTNPTHASPSSSLLAHHTAGMICYIWFSSTIGPLPSALAISNAISRGIHPLSPPARERCQFTPSRSFVAFVQGLLQTTQLSRSVVVLALHYAYRFRQRQAPVVSEGSETRLAVVSLMMANKFVDDNTYTNRTWSDVSGIPLEQINAAEHEFLLGVKHALHVDGPTYESWRLLLRGLAHAKEAGPLGRARRGARARSTSPAGLGRAPYLPPSTSHGQPHAQYPSPISQRHAPSPSPPAPRPCTKRNATDAFSPESMPGTVPAPPAKRFVPPVRLPALLIPQQQQQQQHQQQQAQSAYPLSQPQQALHQLPSAQFTYSMPVPPIQLAPIRPTTQSGGGGGGQAGFLQAPVQLAPRPTTGASQGGAIGAPYQLQGRMPNFLQSQDLYYYSLAASPLDVPSAQKPPRKAVLRYHNPSYSATYSASSSASTSYVPQEQQAPAPLPMYDPSLQLPPLQLPVLPNVQQQSQPQPQQQQQRTASYTRADAHPGTFANAGPPGVHWPVPLQLPEAQAQSYWTQQHTHYLPQQDPLQPQQHQVLPSIRTPQAPYWPERRS